MYVQLIYLFIYACVLVCCSCSVGCRVNCVVHPDECVCVVCIHNLLFTINYNNGWIVRKVPTLVSISSSLLLLPIIILCTRHHFLRLVIPNSSLEGLRPHRHLSWNHPKIHRYAGILCFVWLGKMSALVPIETYPLASIQHERGEISLVRRRLTKKGIRAVHIGERHPKINFPQFMVVVVGVTVHTNRLKEMERTPKKKTKQDTSKRRHNMPTTRTTSTPFFPARTGALPGMCTRSVGGHWYRNPFPSSTPANGAMTSRTNSS